MSSVAVFALIFTIGCAIFVVWYLLKIDAEKQENLKETEEDLIYKKINIIFPNLNKDIF